MRSKKEKGPLFGLRVHLHSSPEKDNSFLLRGSEMSKKQSIDYKKEENLLRLSQVNKELKSEKRKLSLLSKESPIRQEFQ